MTVEVGFPAPAERPAVLALIAEMEEHYSGVALAPETVRERVDLFLPEAGGPTEIAVARLEGRVVGFATFTIMFPAPALTGQLVMKDLFTSASARSHGAGSAIIRWLARLAQKRGCTRLDWTAETGNPGAQRLYDGLGARRVTDKIYYRLDGEALARAAED
jgi:GNAT superfamily N-acetyltransferase